MEVLLKPPFSLLPPTPEYIITTPQDPAAAAPSAHRSCPCVLINHHSAPK